MIDCAVIYLCESRLYYFAMKKRRQSAQYDKIFRENIESVIASIMHHVLDIRAVSVEELPDDIQHTKERKPDTLKKITDDSGNMFVLQIEFQVKDEVEIVYRMLDYYGMLERKYKLPVKQFVIFLGTDAATMPTGLDRERLKFSFPLVSFSALDYQLFVHSANPEEIILGILASFKGEDPENVIRQILVRVKETSSGDFSLQRYFNQLRVLAQLRNLEINLKNAMNSIAEYITEERDVLFLRGLEKGIERGIEKGLEKGQEEFVKNLLTESDFTIEKIAKIAGVTTDFVLCLQKVSQGK